MILDTNLFGLFYTIIVTLFAGSIFYALLQKAKIFQNDDQKTMNGLNLILAFATSFFVAISPFVQNLLRIMTSYMTILIVLGFFILFVFYVFNYNEDDVKLALGEDQKALSTTLFIIILVILIISLSTAMGSDLLNKDLSQSTTLESVDLNIENSQTYQNYNSSEYIRPYQYGNYENFDAYESNNEFEENVWDTFFDSKVLAMILFFLFLLIFISQINGTRRYEDDNDNKGEKNE